MTMIGVGLERLSQSEKGDPAVMRGGEHDSMRGNRSRLFQCSE